MYQTIQAIGSKSILTSKVTKGSSEKVTVEMQQE